MAKKSKKHQIKTKLVRFHHPELYSIIEESARINKRNVNAEIEFVLEKYFLDNP